MTADDVPIGCAARMLWILDRADALAKTFRNGDKSGLLVALNDMPSGDAFAVLATVCTGSQGDAVARYLREAA